MEAKVKSSSKTRVDKVLNKRYSNTKDYISHSDKSKISNDDKSITNVKSITIDFNKQQDSGKKKKGVTYKSLIDKYCNSNNTSSRDVKAKDSMRNNKRNYIPLKVNLTEDKPTSQSSRNLSNTQKIRKGLRIPMPKSSPKNFMKTDKLSSSTTKILNSKEKYGVLKNAKSSIKSRAKKQRSPSEIKMAKGDATQKSTKSITEKTGDTETSKYEAMLKKVNREFELSMKKNAEMTVELANLEIKHHKVQEQLNKTKRELETELKRKKNKNDSSEAEKTELQKLNQDMNQTILEQNEEIDKLKRAKFELENKLLRSDTVSMKSNKNETELREKLTELISKYSILDEQARDKDSQLFKANLTIEALKSELKNIQKIEAARDCEANSIKEERDELYDLSNMLKEKLMKSGVALKQVMSECEDLQRERNIIKNNYDFTKHNEEQLKEENYSLKQKYQRIENDSYQLKEQLRKLNLQQDDTIKELLNIESYMVNNLQDWSSVKSRINLIINNIKLNSNSSKLAARIFSDFAFDEIERVEQKTNTALSEYHSVNNDNFFQADDIKSNQIVNQIDLSVDNSRLTRTRMRQEKIDPFKMKPAGLKSNTDTVFRQDSVQYLDRKRTKTIDERFKSPEFSKQNNMMQSGRLQDNSSLTNSEVKYIPYTTKNKSELDLLYNYKNPRPTSATPDTRSAWAQSMKPEIFELDSFSKRINRDEEYSNHQSYYSNSKVGISENEIDRLIKNFEYTSKPYEWQVNKAQIDLSKDHLSNY